MNKKMDSNFAFAILLLVAAIVGMYFWVNNAGYEMEDIYKEEQRTKITPRDEKVTTPAEMTEDFYGEATVAQ